MIWPADHRFAKGRQSAPAFGRCSAQTTLDGSCGRVCLGACDTQFGQRAEAGGITPQQTQIKQAEISRRESAVSAGLCRYRPGISAHIERRGTSVRVGTSTKESQPWQISPTRRTAGRPKAGFSQRSPLPSFSPSCSLPGAGTARARAQALKPRRLQPQLNRFRSLPNKTPLRGNDRNGRCIAAPAVLLSVRPQHREEGVSFAPLTLSPFDRLFYVAAPKSCVFAKRGASNTPARKGLASC